jgi:hypothetical protein
MKISHRYEIHALDKATRKSFVHDSAEYPDEARGIAEQLRFNHTVTRVRVVDTGARQS